jgi:hypothetical protein
MALPAKLDPEMADEGLWGIGPFRAKGVYFGSVRE